VPLAEQFAPGQADPLQHFITDSPWTIDPLLRVLDCWANTLLGEKQAVLIIDDTCLTKFGRHLVGVARQYSGQVGKITNCQCLVSLTLAKDELPLPLALRLFLPSAWTESGKMSTSAWCSRMRGMATTLSFEKRSANEAYSGRLAL